MCLLLNRKCFGHHHQVVLILAIDRDILKVPLDGSGLLSSVSTEGCAFVEIYEPKLGQKWKNT